jgi:DNA-binding transcriptional LysR family regulator
VDIASLKAYCTVIESGSISKAAKKLFVSQPSLSMKVQDLENRYQTILLERTNKGISPTEAGLVLYQHALKIVSLDQSIERELDPSRGEHPELIVGASSTIGNQALPCTVYNFNEKYPQYKISMKIGNSEHVIEQVVNKRVDLGLIEGPLSDAMRDTLAKEGIKTKRVTTNALVLVVPLNEHWNNISHISLENDFLELPLILREVGSGIRTTLELTLATRSISISDLHIVMELDTTGAIISAVTSGKGVSLLPKMAIRKELHYNILKEVTVDDIVFKHDFTTLYFQDDSQKPVYNAFIKFLHSKERGFC